MRLFKRLACKAIGHEPIYYQARVMTNGRWRWQNRDLCARCDSSDSLEIHTPGVLDFPSWFSICADALRFSLTEWHRRKRRPLLRLFRKRTS
jgi:hypothetical protein